AEEAALNDSGELGRDYHVMRWHPFSVDLLHADGSKARGKRNGSHFRIDSFLKFSYEIARVARRHR
ncbi:hypothetical protein, partial [uncultured Campylobacter sp.]|uniref:hypothetical protein n=1 Tax=uncultured Campylobacter sp. TaxID=218934 RepID=UPI00262FB5C3